MLDDWLDPDIIYSPAYWILTVGCAIAFILGFGGGGIMEGLIDVEYAIPLYIKVILLAATPVISYLIVWKMQS